MEPAFASLNGHRFGVIAVDPPWKFKAGKSNRSTENHYQTMSIEQISALPIASLAAKDAALFLWTTPPFLDLSLRSCGHLLCVAQRAGEDGVDGFGDVFPAGGLLL